MRLAPAKARPRRKAGRQIEPRPHGTKTIPAPVGGWVVSQNLAMQETNTALVLDNFFPTLTGIRPRGGSETWANLAADEPVLSLWSYQTGPGREMFAATAGSIFDISTPSDANAVPSAEVTGQTGGYYSTQQFTTAGGSYLYAVNGEDDALLYDGATWEPINATSTPLALTGVDTDSLSHVWAFGQRLFFVEKDTLTAWYLPVDSIGGEAQPFSLAGIFQRGGSLLFGSTWSLDAGDGLDDKCVFVSDQGEVAIYEGTNPGSASDWRKAGVYEITRPLGPKAKMQAGGDLLIATQNGIVPLSEAVRKDIAALSLAAVSAPIEPEWDERVARRSGEPWEILKWPAKNMMVVSQPRSGGPSRDCLVANLETGKWCRYVGWDVQSLGLFGDIGLFGTSDGRVKRMEVTGSDDGAPYLCIYVGAFDHLGSISTTKTVMQMRAQMKSQRRLNLRLSVSLDYLVTLPTPPATSPEASDSRWGLAKWGAAQWAQRAGSILETRWQSIGRTGFAVAPQVQIMSGSVAPPVGDLISIDLTYETGGTVT